MGEHKPECPMLDSQWPKHPLEVCEYCDMISAAEKRVLDAARQVVDALPRQDMHYSLIDLIDALAAIDALREKP